MQAKKIPSRRHYDSRVVWLYRERKEHLLDKGFRKTIPNSTTSTWRNHPHDIYGTQYIPELNKTVELYELVSENKRLKRLLFTTARVWLKISSTTKFLLRKEKECYVHIVNAIQYLKKHISVTSACRLFSISKEAFSYQLNRFKYTCEESSLGMCFNRHPLQLSKKELLVIKEAYENTEYSCWPGVSIYYYLLRNKQLNIGLSTFYKYVRILGLKRKWGKEKTNSNGVKTTRPNEYLHVDTTYTKSTDGSLSAVVFVSDNFSKAILGWEIAPKNSALNVASALRIATNKMIETNPETLLPTTLMADGGAENHAAIIEELLQEESTPVMKKVIALRDVQFSNSPAEAVNKIFKRYVRKMKPNNYEELKKIIPLIIDDYNNKRPHGTLKGLTPWECYTQKLPKFDFQLQIQQQKQLRIVQNKQFNCNMEC